MYQQRIPLLDSLGHFQQKIKGALSKNSCQVPASLNGGNQEVKLTVTICMKGQAVDRTEHLNALVRFTNEKTVSFATYCNLT